MNLVQALRLLPFPCLALVGAGGKTTALFQLARELAPPVIVTATAHLAVEQAKLADRHIIARITADLNILKETPRAGVILVTGPIDGSRTQGISNGVTNWLHAFCCYHDLPLLIEANGSRQKPLKAPAEHEPPIPPFVEMVIVVAGLSGLGKPLTDEWVYRAERFEQISKMAMGQIITIEEVARALSHPDGGLKNIPKDARRVALINQADTPELQARAKGLAEQLLPTYHAIVIAALNQQSAIHAVYEPVGGIVLAAGASARFGQPKQLLDYHGQPLVRAVAQTALAAGLSPVVLVTGANAEQVESAVKGLPVKVVRNEEWHSGQSSSIRAGLSALTPSPSPMKGKGDVGAAIFLLADQPQVTPPVLRALIERHASDLSPIVAPLVGDRRANPVLFDCVTFPDLISLTGDVGGRGIFSKYPITYLPWHDENLLLDVDTPENHARLENQE